MKTDNDQKILSEELFERIAYVTGELDEIVEITTGKKTEEVSSVLRRPTTFESIFKYLVLKNVTRGRMVLSVYFSGKETGFATQVKSQESLIKVIRRLGLGELFVKNFSDPDICLELKNSFSSRDIKGVKTKICYFEAGFLGGAIENLLGVKVDFKEVQCRAEAGGDVCLFEMIKPGEQIKIEGVTIPIMTFKEYSAENVKLLTSLASHAIAAIENALVFETTRKQALVDGLTEVYNHRFFQQTIRSELKRAIRHNMPLALLMCDINLFKKFNDQFGHSVGDTALKKIARILLTNIRDIDFVSRYGGDEFSIILPQTDQTGAWAVAHRIKQKVEESTFPHQDSMERLGLSIGIVSFSGSGNMDAQTLIDKADNALLQAKQTKDKLFMSHKNFVEYQGNRYALSH